MRTNLIQDFIATAKAHPRALAVRDGDQCATFSDVQNSELKIAD